MADSQFTRINEKFALAYDNLQWVIQRMHLSKGVETWRPVAFVRSNKFRLFHAMVRYGVPSDDALNVCESLPETFVEFIAMLDASGRDSVISAPNHPMETPTPERDAARINVNYEDKENGDSNERQTTSIRAALP